MLRTALLMLIAGLVLVAGMDLPKLHRFPRWRRDHCQCQRCNGCFVASVLARPLGAPALSHVLARSLGPRAL
jgi:5-methylcytosine-specific restriction endonuclease McrA